MKKIIIAVTCFALVIGIGYYFNQRNTVYVGTQPINTKTERQVLSYLKNQKYHVEEFNDKGYYAYTLTENRLKQEPNSTIWSSIQNPNQYIGKKIEEHYAVVTDHPIQKQFPKQRINLTIIKVDGKIIGGISQPEEEQSAVYQLDGTSIQ